MHVRIENVWRTLWLQRGQSPVLAFLVCSLSLKSLLVSTDGDYYFSTFYYMHLYVVCVGLSCVVVVARVPVPVCECDSICAVRATLDFACRHKMLIFIAL